MSAPRCLGSTPMASRSGAYVRPGTSVTSSRPRHITSRLASCLARRSTWRPGSSIVVPSFTRGFRAAAQARPTAGSSTGPVSTSDSHSESKPRSSSAVTSSASASGDAVAPPLPTPIRIFMSGRLQSHDLVEASEADEQRRVGRELDDLRLGEVAAQLGPQRVVDLVVVDGELVGEPDGRPLARAQQIRALVVDRGDLGFRRTGMPAPGIAHGESILAEV